MTKDSKDSKLFGVCSGVAKYFGIDPTLVRLAFVAAVIFFGTGLGIYLIMALVMPSDNN